MVELIDKSLLLARSTDTFTRAVTLQQLLATRGPKLSVDAPSDAPTAIVPEDHVETGHAYEATDGGAQFALPTYGLEVVDGRYTSSLRWRRPEDDPNGPIAFLILKLSAIMPPGTREIAHQASVRLTTSVAVSDSPDQAATLSTELGALVRTSPTTAEVTHAMNTKAEFDALWLAITDPGSPATAELSATVVVRRRVWRPRWRPTVMAVTEWHMPHQEFIVPLGPSAENHPEWPRKTTMDMSQFLVSPMLAGVVGMKLAENVNPVLTEPASPVLAENTTMKLMTAAHPLLAENTGLKLTESASPLLAKGVSPTEMRMDVSILKDRLDPDVTQLRRRDGDDGPIFDGPHDTVPHMPVHFPLDPVPMLVELTLPLSVAVGPFAFPVETNAYMFDVPGDLRPQTTRLLLRHEFDPGSDRPRLVYYEDTAFPNRYYYEPQQFRVPRDDAEPYLPRLAIAFTDVSVTDEQGTPSVQYTARLRYSAVPDLDGLVLTALRRELAALHGTTDLDLTALLPETATLSLQLPDDTAGGQLVAITHTLTSDAFDDGFSDEIELSVSEFAAAMALLQSDALRGTIVADLLGAGHTAIPVELSLRDTPAVPLHRAYRGPVGNSLVRVSVLNPLESPVQLVELYRVSPATGVSAFPQSAPGLRIPAGGSADLDYTLTPDDASVDDLVPAVRAVVDADLRALLPKVMVNSGYSDQTFALTVRTDPTLLSRATAQGPLIGLLVQFEGDVEVVLDATTPSRDTGIRMPILPWLLKDADAQRYRYRVVNLHGTADAPLQGEVGDWVAGVGGGTLTVAPTAG